MTKHINHITANADLSPTQNDVTFIADAANLAINLPDANAETKGNVVRLVTSTVSSSGVGFKAVPKAADAIRGTGITGAAAKYVENTTATDALGDELTLQSDGQGSWWIIGKIGTWARET